MQSNEPVLNTATITRIKTWLEAELIASDEEIRTELSSSEDGQLKITAEIGIRLMPGGKSQIKCTLKVPGASYKSEPAVFDCQMQLPGM